VWWSVSQSEFFLADDREIKKSSADNKSLWMTRQAIYIQTDTQTK